MFPLAIGGSLVTDRVCKPCNDLLGSRVDSALTNHLLIQLRRAELDLRGNSGSAPTIEEPLIGTWPLASDPRQKVRVTFNKQTGKFEFWTVPKFFDAVMPDGSPGRQLIFDVSDVHRFPFLLDRERKRHGLPSLSTEAMEEECRKLAAPENIRTTENPTLHVTMQVDSRRIAQALLKIVYELAFIWLGERYIEDPRAAIIRDAILSEDAAAAEEILKYTGSPSEWPALSFWQPHRAHHLAFVTDVAGALAICVRIFDTFAGSAVITDSSACYLSGCDPDSKLRFLVMDARDGRQHESSVRVEQLRLAHEQVMRRRTSSGGDGSNAGWDRLEPLPDPLGPD